MRTIAEHAEHARALALRTPATRLDLEAALGHVLAEDLRSPTELPRWDNSSMDGYAVRSQDVAGASEDAPVQLPVRAELPAGTDRDDTLVPGTAARIMTGAPVPPGADAIVQVERTDGGTTQVAIHAPAPVGQFIRRAGGDVVPGDLVLPSGTELGPAQLAAAASLGVGELAVYRRPRVAVLSTGDELVEPGRSLRRGQLPDSNSYLLAAAVRLAGAEPVRVGAIPDQPGAFRELLDGLLTATGEDAVDAVITSGGVSMGAYDVVKGALRDEPGMAFVQIPMQPGRPQGLGSVSVPGRAGAGVPLFALPGNPVSAFVSFEVFVRPALQLMRGSVRVERERVVATAGSDWRCPPGREQYMPVVLERAASDGASEATTTGLVVHPASAGGSDSHLVAGLARAQALAIVPAEVDQVRAGDRLAVMLTP